jgi:hypothetical protein
LHFIGHIILHHFSQTYNPFFNFSVTHKKASGKTEIWWIFPEVVKQMLSNGFILLCGATF